jgi:hypothetical protein
MRLITLFPCLRKTKLMKNFAKTYIEGVVEDEINCCVPMPWNFFNEDFCKTYVDGVVETTIPTVTIPISKVSSHWQYVKKREDMYC